MNVLLSSFTSSDPTNCPITLSSLSINPSPNTNLEFVNAGPHIDIKAKFPSTQATHSF